MKTISAHQLSLTHRFDIFAKHLYARMRELKINSNWHEELYAEHIRIFNCFVENDGSGKHGKEAFCHSFNQLLDSIKHHGYTPELEAVPVGINSVPINGAHRISACLLYDKPLLIRDEPYPATDYGYDYFVKNGLDLCWSDAIATEFVKLRENAFMAFLFPSATGHFEKMLEILSEHSRIFYHKSIKLTKNGSLQSIQSLYHQEPWLGTEKDNYQGAQNKTFFCYRSEQPLLIFAVEGSIESMNQAKSEIRKLYGIGNHSIHMTDTHHDAKRLSHIFFNQNSIHFLNYRKSKSFKKFEALFTEYKNTLQQSVLNSDEFCVDSGAVLPAYGIRDVNDFDYLHQCGLSFTEGPKDINCHNDQIGHYQKTVDDILYNPVNHFYYQGLKFASLSLLRDMKVNRHEPKDVTDISLIDQFLKADNHRFFQSLTASAKIAFSPSYRYAKLRMLKLKIRYFLYRAYYTLKLLKNRGSP